MRTTVSIQLEVRRIRDTASGSPGKAHLVVNGTVIHPGHQKSPKSWPWERPTIRVSAKEFTENPCVECLKGLEDGLNA
jgi:hypothetical protein